MTERRQLAGEATTGANAKDRMMKSIDSIIVIVSLLGATAVIVTDILYFTRGAM